ncbi:MAG: hypothetical protein KAI72_06825 [Candidatus Pacebacteria bacterium]|nr:hypothetical protein [Candidatus Paceibacterota bacterium]
MAKQIDEALLLDKIDPNTAAQVIELIAKNTSLYQYFFKKVNAVVWFNYLDQKNYFDVNEETILFDTENNAYFWGVLDYLERVSEQVSQDPQYEKDIIEIIDNLVNFSIARQENKSVGVRNYHIWWYCVKILNNLSPSAIKKHISIKKFKKWLTVFTDSTLGSDLTISDLGKNILPKTLTDDFGPNYEYSENIIYAITAIKAKEQKGSFARLSEAVFEWQSFWILDAFKKCGKTIGQKCRTELIVEMADRLRHSLEYKKSEHHAHFDIGDNTYRITIHRIPSDEMSSGKIKFIENKYNCKVKQFSVQQLEKIDYENDFWALHNLQPNIEKESFIFEAKQKETFFLEVKNNLSKEINWDEERKLKQKIEGIYEGLYADYSHIWCRALKNGPEHDNDAEDILTIILKDILLAKCEGNSENGRKILNLFLKDSKYQFPIFRRFILLCIDMYWEQYSDVLPLLIDVVPTILMDNDLEYEMQDVLRNHNKKFNESLNESLKRLIDNVPEYYLEKKEEKLAAYWKYKWLSPLSENNYFTSFYKEARVQAEVKEDKPYEPEQSAFVGGFVTHKAPITKEKLRQLSVPEIVKYLDEFKSPEFWKSTFEGEPDKEGLAQVLQEAIKEEPEKFIDGITAFLDINYFYLQRIIRGIKDVWNSGKDIDWNKIIDFIIRYLDRDKEEIIDEALKAQGDDSGSGRYIWIVESIVELIGDASKDDARDFSKDNFDRVEKIFDLIIPLLKGEEEPDTQRDVLTYAINTTLGRTIMAYISFSLRVARSTKQKKEGWGKDRYDRFLSIGVDGYILFGCYLPQMYYLDKNYTLEFIEKGHAEFNWQMFMEGYLTGARIYKELYKLMRPHYERALGTTAFEDRADKRLIDHICIGYLDLDESLSSNNEDGKPSLFWKMINEIDDKEKKKRLEDVASFFWSRSGKRIQQEASQEKEQKLKQTQQKVIAFWRWTFEEQNTIKERLNDSYDSFLGRMAELSRWLDNIDEETEKWLLLSAPYIGIQYRSTFFMEYLTKFKDKGSLKRIGKIFLKLLETTTPTFKKEDILLIVERLYEMREKDSKFKADADNICNTYGKRGVHFLKELFFKYNKLKTEP